MTQRKAPNEGTVPCLVCDSRYEYLTSRHLSSTNCEPDGPSNIEAYRSWVAAEFDVDDSDPIFETNQIQQPQHYRKHAERLGLPK